MLVAGVDVAGHLADRPFQGVQRLGGARTDGLVLDPAQALPEIAARLREVDVPELRANLTNLPKPVPA